MARSVLDNVIPRPPCGCLRAGVGGRCQKDGGCAPGGAWVSYYQALATFFGSVRVSSCRGDGCGGSAGVVGVTQGVDCSSGLGCGRLCFGSVEGVRMGIGENGASDGQVLQSVQARIDSGGQGSVDKLVSSRDDGGADGEAFGLADMGGRCSACGTQDGVARMGKSSVVEEKIDLGFIGDADSVRHFVEHLEESLVNDDASQGVSERTLLNRARREKAKFRKIRKRERQGVGARSKDWNADKVERSKDVVQDVSSRGYFSSCTEDVRKQLVETRALRLTVENKLRVAEMEQKMQVMRLQTDSRLVERKFENDRMKVEIEAKKRISEMPGGTVETVISSGSISPNSSISLAAENRLRKDLADANEKLAKLSGSSVGGSVLSETERELRLANFELGSIGLRNRAFADVTFTDCDYKIALQALRDEYADVLLSDEKRVERKAVEKVLEVLARKVDDDDLEEIAKLGYLDADTLIY